MKNMIRLLGPALWSGLLIFVIESGRAADATISLGRVQAHPTRILAQLRKPGPLPGQQLGELGFVVGRTFPAKPGLVEIDGGAGALAAREAGADRPRQSARLMDRIKALRATRLFEFVEPDFVVLADASPTDSAFVDGTLWGLRNSGQNGGTPGADIGAVEAWNITTGSKDVVVAIIDSGIRYTHQDLAAQMWRNAGEVPGNGIDDDRDGYVDNVFGINAIVGSGDPFDDNDHGTHVAGTIGGAANDGHPLVGVAWNVQLMACKFLGADGRGFTSDAVECINFAVSHGARILNNSWSGGRLQLGFGGRHRGGQPPGRVVCGGRGQ